VDGQWEVAGDSVHPAVSGYDRLIAIGDVTWTDYEITVPVTIERVDPEGYDPPSYTPLVGLLMRWKGHTDVDGTQPPWGYNPLGGLACYRYFNDALGDRLFLLGNNDQTLSEDT